MARAHQESPEPATDTPPSAPETSPTEGPQWDGVVEWTPAEPSTPPAEARESVSTVDPLGLLELGPLEPESATEEELLQTLATARTAYAEVANKVAQQKKNRPKERKNISGVRMNLLREDLTPVEGAEETRREYLSAVQAVRKMQIEHARKTADLELNGPFIHPDIRVASTPETQEQMRAVLTEFSVREHTALYDEQTRLRLTPGESSPLHDRAWKCVQRTAEWYNNLDAHHRDPTKSRFHIRNLPYNKLMISVGLMGGSLVAGTVGLTALGAIAAGGKIAQRILGGAAAGVAVDAFISNRFQRKHEKATLKGLDNVPAKLAYLANNLDDILTQINADLDQRLLASVENRVDRHGRERLISRTAGLATGALGGGLLARGVQNAFAYGLDVTGLGNTRLGQLFGLHRTPDTSAPAIKTSASNPPLTGDQLPQNLNEQPAAINIEIQDSIGRLSTEPPVSSETTSAQPAPTTPPESAKVSTTVSPEQARLQELATVRKGEGAWQAVRRQFYERVKTNPAKYGLTDADAKKLTTLDAIGRGTKVDKILNRETLATLKSGGFINPDGTTKLGISKPGVKILLDTEGRVIPPEGKGNTYEFKGRARVDTPSSGARKTVVGSLSPREHPIVGTTRSPELMTIQESSASAQTPVIDKSVLTEVTAKQVERANMGSLRLSKADYGPIMQVKTGVFLDDFGRPARNRNLLIQRPPQSPSILSTPRVRATPLLDPDTPRARKYFALSRRLEAHLKTLPPAEQVRLRQKPIEEVFRTVSLKK